MEDGRAAARLGDDDAARTALRNARDLAREHGMPHLVRTADEAVAAVAT